MVTSTTETAKTAKKRVTEQNAPMAIFTFNKCLISIRSIRNAPGFKPTLETFLFILAQVPAVEKFFL